MDTEITSPIDDLASCHSGILTRLDTLSELPALRAAATRVQGIASESLDFFGEVILQHHLAEERELFPTVIQAAEGSERETVKWIISRPIQEHSDIEQSWKRLAPGLKGLTKDQFDRFDDATLAVLVERYRDHANFEETEFLSLANRLLQQSEGGLDDQAMSIHKRHSSAYGRAID